MAATPAKQLDAGDKAPDFRLESHDGSSISPGDYRNHQALVLFFYPRANTSG